MTPERFVIDVALTHITRPSVEELEAMMVRATRFYYRFAEVGMRERACERAREWAAEIDREFNVAFGRGGW